MSSGRSATGYVQSPVLAGAGILADSYVKSFENYSIPLVHQPDFTVFDSSKFRLEELGSW